MSNTIFTTKKVIDEFQLKVVAGVDGLDRLINVSDLHRPAFELAGFFTNHPHERIQIIGKTELSFVEELSPQERQERFQKICSYTDTPCLVVAHGDEAPEDLIQIANQASFPILQSTLSTTKLISKLTNYLESELSPRTTLHGVLVEVYGVGVLMTGNSGIGKSETALELLKRGHRLVADDAVEIKQTAEHELIGSAPDLIQCLMEIRGLGILNIMTMFGAGAVRINKKITMVVQLEYWDSRKSYDRLGLDEQTMRILDTDLPMVTIPVRPGRNVAIIVEVAAMNYRLKRMGYNSAMQFSKRLNDIIEESEDF